MKCFFVSCIFLSTTTLATIAFATCPPKFTSLGKLGCIQKNIEGQTRCIEAIQKCFQTYGGRLPSYSEMVAALTSGIEPELKYEWVDSSSVNTYTPSGSTFQTMNQNCGLIGTKSLSPLAEVYYNKTIGFRCFVPFVPSNQDQ